MKSQLSNLHPTLRMKLPFLAAGFLSFLFSVYLYFVLDEESAGIFVGLWVPSIHSLGTLMLTPTADATPSTESTDRVSAHS
jgi:hypothetical protein